MMALIGVALFRHGDRAMAVQDSEDKVSVAVLNRIWSDEVEREHSCDAGQVG